MKALIASTLMATATAALAAPMPVAPAHVRYEITARWSLPGGGGWDCLTVDAPRHRLFIARSDHVDVVNTSTGRLIGTIHGTDGVHAVALAPALHRGFTTNGRGNSITEFDYDTLAVLRTTPVPGENPDAILYVPATQHLYAFNGRSKDAAVFDAKTLTLAAKIPLPDKPEFAVADGRGQVFLNIESEAGQLAVIDDASLTVRQVWALPGCASPSGLAIDVVQGRLFSACDGKVMAITDVVTGAAVARVPIGDGPDGAEFDAHRKLAFSSNGEGSLSIVGLDAAGHYGVTNTLVTERGARTMALDADSGKIYLVTSRFDPAPPADAAHPHPRPVPIPGTFTVLVVEPR